MTTTCSFGSDWRQQPASSPSNYFFMFFFFYFTVVYRWTCSVGSEMDVNYPSIHLSFRPLVHRRITYRDNHSHSHLWLIMSGLPSPYQACLWAVEQNPRTNSTQRSTSDLLAVEAGVLPTLATVAATHHIWRSQGVEHILMSSSRKHNVVFTVTDASHWEKSDRKLHQHSCCFVVLFFCFCWC